MATVLHKCGHHFINEIAQLFWLPFDPVMDKAMAKL